MPKPKRVTVPKAVEEAVLAEFRHRCALCGRDRPQIHHIDEDPSNPDPANLIPLCPNHHLLDIHNPTEPIDRGKIALFRRLKDPLILDHRFTPIWRRMEFLRRAPLAEAEQSFALSKGFIELQRFVGVLKMGDYYEGAIKRTWEETFHPAHMVGEYDVSTGKNAALPEAEYRAVVTDGMRRLRPAIEDVCVELLRYQAWQVSLSSGNDRTESS